MKKTTLLLSLLLWSVALFAQPAFSSTDLITVEGTNTIFKRPLSDLTTFILGNGFTAFTGPTTSVKTFTLPNASATILTSNAPVTVAQGGTGLTALGTANQQLRVNAGATALEYFTPSAGSGDITNGGNTTGAAVTIGTNDAFGLNLETNGTTRLSITGAASTGGAATLTEVTASTNAVTNSLTVAATSTGTAAAGFGSGLLLQGESSTTNSQDMGRVSALWTTATHASRTSALQFSGVNNAGALSEVARFESATAPVLKIASAMGTAGTTTYANAGITSGVSPFTITGGSNNVVIGGSTGSQTIGNGGQGDIFIFNASTSASGLLIANTSNTATAVGGIRFGSTSTTFTQTSGTRNVVDFTQNFAPTSGTAVHNMALFGSTINQTGGASGIVRGIYMNQTNTATADFRALELSTDGTNTGGTARKAIYQTGSAAVNNFVGKTTFGATTAPTSLLMLAAGTTTVSPLKFTSGTNLTTPEAGAVEFDGTNYYVTSSTTRYTLAKTLKVSSTIDFASIAANDAAVTSVTVTGATVGNPVVLGLENTVVNTGIVFTVWVHGTNTVRIEARNVTGGAIDLVSASYTFSVLMY